MGVKRIYLNPFIANIIPILIVALMMFVVLYVSSNEEGGRAGLTTMNVIQSSAGFLFILILAHVNERTRIETLTLATMFRGVRWKLFRWQDNLTLKLVFWPLLLAIWFSFTLARFY